MTLSEGFLDLFLRQNFLFLFYNFTKNKVCGFNPFKYTSYQHHQVLQHHQHLQRPQHQQEKHRPTFLYLFHTIAVSYFNSSFWDRNWNYLFVQNFFEIKSPTKHCSPLPFLRKWYRKNSEFSMKILWGATLVHVLLNLSPM